MAKAIAAYERAIKYNPQQPRFYDELDRLYERNGTDISTRYHLLSDNLSVIAEHSRPLIRAAMVATAMEDYDKAIDILRNNYFNAREGRSGLHDIYVDALLLRGQKHLREKKWKLALQDFKDADLYPVNHSIGRDEDSERRAQIFYLTGIALDKMGKKAAAKNWFEKAIQIKVKQPEYNFQKAMAYQHLGDEVNAKNLFDELGKVGASILEKQSDVDFFSKFGGNQIENKRKASAHYLLGLASLGEGDNSKAKDYFEKTIQLYPGHAWASWMLKEL